MKTLFRLSQIISLIFFITISPTIQIGHSQSSPISLIYNSEQNYVITFINYDETLIDAATIESGLPTRLGNDISYNINYEFNFANQTYEDQINSFVDQVSTLDWTSSLNSTALEEQKLNFERKSIFDRQNGTAIDAQKLENFMVNNPVATTLPDENRFYLYVFNLSRLDSIDNNHWFNVTEVDPDSNRARFFWRLEWDYDLGENYNVKFPYAGYSNATEISLIDPTSFQWYLEWRAIWNANTDFHPSYFDDLGTLIQGLDPVIQQILTTETITVWLDDWVSKIYNMQFIPEKLGSSLSIQMEVLYRGSESTQQNLEWIVNAELVKKTVNNLLQTNDIEAVVQYTDLETDAFMNNLFLGAKTQYSDFQGAPDPFSNWEFYDGIFLWNAINNDNTLNANYFNNNAAEIVVKGLLYLVDNSSYVGPTNWIPWKGGLYTGLGGSRIMTMLWELDRAFMSDHTTRKSGLSRVLIHEIGHAIGIPHTFDNQGDATFDTFTSDFALDVMGYYPGVANYSEILSKLYQRAAVDSVILELIQMYQTLKSTRNDTLLTNVSELFNEGINLHKRRQYQESYSKMNQALTLLIDNVLISTTSPESNTTPLLTTIDTDPPAFNPTTTTHNTILSDQSSTYGFKFSLGLSAIILVNLVYKFGRNKTRIKK